MEPPGKVHLESQGRREEEPEQRWGGWWGGGAWQAFYMQMFSAG